MGFLSVPGRPTLAGISGTTKYVFEQEDEANRSQTTRRFKRVASSSALLPPAACPKKEEEDDAASSANRARAAPALAQSDGGLSADQRRELPARVKLE